MDHGRPRVLIFDVNETLSDMSRLKQRFEEVGVPRNMMPSWFAGILREGFALAASGGYADFLTIARDELHALLPRVEGWSGDPEIAAEHLVGGFADLGVHPDVPGGVRALHDGGYRLATMTNGSAALTRGLLGGSGLGDCFETLLDVTGPRCWKPARAAYLYAAEQLGIDREDAMLVAVHPWDVDGAQRAGLRGAWLHRGAGRYPSYLLEPTLVVRDVDELAATLTS